ncbi:putative COP9 signalosome complex subunit 7B [Triangularia verruculosa]|uniref:COP9 signalosome complex subunit 7B n=1 Tax=Triangularia verruculosa TaxID=2587418 RepID=A0AAN7AQZ2_9PEZI|nr:putative COP9 signalosome complex subunit 7B [Triangularia verruculosa]
MEQAKALTALEPFLALTKSATSPRAAAGLISRATSAPNTYIFTELLQAPQIQALASNPELAPHLTLLQIFSYGTYQTYKSTAGLPELNEAQQLKLRQLSLLTLANQNNGEGSEPALSYAYLQRALDLPTRQSLEELVISSIYADLIKGQLNPKASLVQVNSVAPLRDVAPTAIGGLLSSLQAWADRCDSTLSSLSAQMDQLRADADRRAAQETTWAETTERLLQEQDSGNKHDKKKGFYPSFSSSSTFIPGYHGGFYNQPQHKKRKSFHDSQQHFGGSLPPWTSGHYSLAQNAQENAYSNPSNLYNVQTSPSHHPHPNNSLKRLLTDDSDDSSFPSPSKRQDQERPGEPGLGGGVPAGSSRYSPVGVQLSGGSGFGEDVAMGDVPGTNEEEEAMIAQAMENSLHGVHGKGKWVYP